MRRFPPLWGACFLKTPLKNESRTTRYAIRDMTTEAKLVPAQAGILTNRPNSPLLLPSVRSILIFSGAAHLRNTVCSSLRLSLREPPTATATTCFISAKRHPLYICRESSTNSLLFMQNKPNLLETRNEPNLC